MTFGAEYCAHGTILLVEDDRSVRELVELVLVRLGFRVLPASDGAGALELWRSHRAEVDLLITDLVLPGGMDGLELVRRLRLCNGDLKSIVLSGYLTDAVKKAVKSSVDMVAFQKPFDHQEFSRVIGELLGVPKT